MIQTLVDTEIVLRNLAREREAHVAQGHALRALQAPGPERPARRRERLPRAAAWATLASNLFSRFWDRGSFSPSRPRGITADA